MNRTRRNFLGNLLLAGAAFTILPGAGRVWRAQRVMPFNPADYQGKWTINPDWVTAPYEVRFWPNDGIVQAVMTPHGLRTADDGFDYSAYPAGTFEDRYVYDVASQRYKLVPRFIRQPPQIRKAV